jgi:hypothetical protein
MCYCSVPCWLMYCWLYNALLCYTLTMPWQSNWHNDNQWSLGLIWKKEAMGLLFEVIMDRQVARQSSPWLVCATCGCDSNYWISVSMVWIQRHVWKASNAHENRQTHTVFHCFQVPYSLMHSFLQTIHVFPHILMFSWSRCAHTCGFKTNNDD